MRLKGKTLKLANVKLRIYIETNAIFFICFKIQNRKKIRIIKYKNFSWVTN